MLPASKAGSPKCLYLDQNKWIDLARAYHGQPRGKRFEPALDALQRACAAGSVVVPMSGVHILETAFARDPGRRRRLAEFMVRLSRNRGLAPFEALRRIEVLQAVQRVLGMPTAGSLRPHVIGNGLAYATGAEIRAKHDDPAVRASMMEWFHRPETSVELLVGLGEREAIGRQRSYDEVEARELDAERRRRRVGLPFDELRRFVIGDLLGRGGLGEDIRRALEIVRTCSDHFKARVPNTAAWDEFFLSIPFVDVYANVTALRDRDADRLIVRNDVNDMDFLAVSVPYCNAVVLEKYAAGLLRTAKLDEKWNTRVETDTARIPELLHELCGD